MKSLIHKSLHTNAGFGALILRLSLALVFIAHGAQKLFAQFGGNGLEATTGFMTSLGIEPAFFWAVALASTEYFGGWLLLLGFLTRFAALGLTVVMTVAIVMVHWQHGFFINQGGYEFAMVLWAGSVALLFQGAGTLSLDKWLSRFC